MTFHSSISFNAILSIDINDPEGSFELITDPVISQYNQQFEVLEATQIHYKLKFISKEIASKVKEKLDDTYKETITTRLTFDQLTHPGNIYVKGLTKELDNQDLLELFQPFGEISSCKIALNQFGQSKGYAFVNFFNGESAQDAIDKLNGLLINGSKLYLNHHISKKERTERMDFERLNFTNLYIKNLPSDLTEQDLEDLFGKFGEIDSVFLPDLANDDIHKDQGKRFGFVNYREHDSAVEAILNLDSKEIRPDLFLSVTRAQRRDERTGPFYYPRNEVPTPAPVTLVQIPSSLPLPAQSTSPPPNFYPVKVPVPGPNQQQSNLYIKNLSSNVTDQVLYDHFSKFGRIISAKVMTLEDDITSRGFGFVCFKTVNEASNAMLQTDNTEFDYHIISVSFAQRNNKKGKSNHQHGGNLYFNNSSNGSGGATPLPVGISNIVPSYYYGGPSGHIPLSILPHEYYYDGARYGNRYRNGYYRQNHYHLNTSQEREKKEAKE